MLEGMAGPTQGDDSSLRYSALAQVQLGPQAVAINSDWTNLARDGKWMAAIYRTCGLVAAGMLRIDGCHIDDRAKLTIAATVGRIAHHEETGECVELCEAVEFDPARLVWLEIIDPIASEDVDRFRQYQDALLRIATRLS